MVRGRVTDISSRTIVVPGKNSGDCGCCGGPGTVRVVDVGGQSVGINKLDQIIRVVRGRGFESEEDVKRELLRLTRLANYVPPGAADAYREALWREYKETT